MLRIFRLAEVALQLLPGTIKEFHNSLFLIKTRFNNRHVFANQCK